MKIIESSLYKQAATSVWYHGSREPISQFDLNHLGNGHDAEGPGIYFTIDRKDALNYLYPGGRLYTVELNLRKCISPGTKVNKREVVALIGRASDLTTALSNWDENPVAAKQMLINECANRATDLWDAFQNVWINVYRYREQEFLNNLVSMGYDAALTDPSKTAGVGHIVVFNPASIRIVKEELH